MKGALIHFAIYISGCVFAYKYFKYLIVKSYTGCDWTKGDRLICIFASTGSWIAVFAVGVVSMIKYFSENEGKANW